MPFLFISCGQYTKAEQSLGKAVARLAEEITGLDAFFAEEVQDLNGLDANILNALHGCAGFITILHPRGRILRPDGSAHVRASVWIEQEIAIATYIQRVEKRALPVIAFVHESVGREGLRELIHLNPIRFKDDPEVLAALPERLQRWRGLRVNVSDVLLELRAGPQRIEQEHRIRQLEVRLINNTNQRITTFNCEVLVPAGILAHWRQNYALEKPSDDARYRRFVLDERYQSRAVAAPRSTAKLMSFDYCTRCAANETGESEAIAMALVAESTVQATVWIDGNEYNATRTIRQLAEEAVARGAG